MKEQKQNKVLGVVFEALPNTLFRVELKSGEEMLAYLSGKMRKYRIKVLVGDKVEIETDSYGGKGRITRRF
ncbi:translation initiation factor IF-1 [bacterium]|jgi:translation initiation factor IF-1|nr:translation initiation factor IF-1 [bacterium]|tara:strand:- start:454 stop:666 length:213 start_codon:yes stop_codon:yes gene_type:complete